MGASIFLDAAVVDGSGGASGSTRWIDLGGSLFADHGDDEVSVSLAHGSEGWVASIRVTPSAALEAVSAPGR
jgi:hypothetical protein